MCARWTDWTGYVTVVHDYFFLESFPMMVFRKYYLLTVMLLPHPPQKNVFNKNKKILRGNLFSEVQVNSTDSKAQL